MKTLLSHFTKSWLGLSAALLLLSAEARAQVTYTDTVCAGSQDVIYGISGALASSTYTWWLSTGGAIDNSMASNDSVIQIDWGNAVGTYTLYSYETTASGCVGDTVQLNIVLSSPPAVAITGDSVCAGFQANLSFDFTGTGPWIVEYTDGTSTFTDTASSTPLTVSLPAYNSAKTISVTHLIDGGSCQGNSSAYPSASIGISTGPTTGPIYHY